MKFTNLLTLLAATSALAHHLKRDEFDDEAQKLGPLYDGVNTEEFENAANAADSFKPLGDAPTDAAINNSENDNCPNLSLRVMECLGKIVGKPIEEACNLFESDEGCQAVVKEDFSACFDKSLINATLYTGLRGTCIKDENGNYCPLAKAQQEFGEKTINEKIIDEKMIDETCKSKKCSEETSEIYTRFLETVKRFDDKPNVDLTINKNFEEVIQKFGKCAAASSAASTTPIKFGSALLATLAVAFYLF